MPLKTTIAALFVALAPVAGVAGGCIHSDQQAQSCASGYVWDAQTQTCTEQASS